MRSWGWASVQKPLLELLQVPIQALPRQTGAVFLQAGAEWGSIGFRARRRLLDFRVTLFSNLLFQFLQWGASQFFRVEPGTLQGGQVGALSGHLAGQGEEFHPPQ